MDAMETVRALLAKPASGGEMTIGVADVVKTESTMDVRMLAVRASKRGVPTMDVGGDVELLPSNDPAREVRESAAAWWARDGEEMEMSLVPPSPPSKATRMELDTWGWGEVVAI
jgi:hypothetical protein